MIPTQLCQLKSNTAFAPDFGIFEIGRVVTGLDEKQLCIEKKKLGITLYSKVKPLPVLYFELKNMLDVIVSDLKHQPLTYQAVQPAHAYQHPRNLNQVLCGDTVLGEIGLVHPTVLRKLDKKAAVVYAELDMNALSAVKNASIQYEEPGRFPAIEMDLSFVAQTFAPIAQAIREAQSPIVKAVEVTDIYEGEDAKSITTRITFAHPERTLKREEVQAVADRIIASLREVGIELKG